MGVEHNLSENWNIASILHFTVFYQLQSVLIWTQHYYCHKLGGGGWPSTNLSHTHSDITSTTGVYYVLPQPKVLTLHIKWHWPIPIADWCHTAFGGLNKRFLYLSFYFCLCLQTPLSFMYKWGPLSSMDGTLPWEILPLSQVCLSTVLSQFTLWCVWYPI